VEAFGLLNFLKNMLSQEEKTTSAPSQTENADEEKTLVKTDEPAPSSKQNDTHSAYLSFMAEHEARIKRVKK